MLKEGALKNPNAELIIGQHVYPQLEAGQVGFKKGMYMASADEIYVTVKGKGGHGALPNACIDSIFMIFVSFKGSFKSASSIASIFFWISGS